MVSGDSLVFCIIIPGAGRKGGRVQIGLLIPPLVIDTALKGVIRARSAVVLVRR